MKINVNWFPQKVLFFLLKKYFKHLSRSLYDFISSKKWSDKHYWNNLPL